MFNVALENKKWSNITNPQAAVIIWNYEYRIDTVDVDDAHKITEIIIPMNAIKSISTQKMKSQAAGQWSIELAPTYNWISRLTVGSWLAIMMTRDTIIDGLVDGTIMARPEELKMFGRIDHIQQGVSVDQESGTRITTFVLSGRDWGAVFDTILYVDKLYVGDSSPNVSPLTQGMTVVTDAFMIDMHTITNAETGLPMDIPSCGALCEGFIKLWGSYSSNMWNKTLPTDSGMLLNTYDMFKLPQSAVNFLYYEKGLTEGISLPATNTNSCAFGDLIDMYHGQLVGYDKYTEDKDEAFCLVSPDSIQGQHSLWQVLSEYANPTICELFTDLRWSDEDGWHLACYRRIKPFLNRGEGWEGDSEVEGKYKSLFKDVKRTTINVRDIVSINAGTNWEERINFIELVPNLTGMLTGDDPDTGFYDSQMKSAGQTWNQSSITRDGFKPLFLNSKYFPAGNFKITDTAKWKWLLREWYFNSALMLNGSVTFVGQNNFIGVGENIMMNAQALSMRPSLNSGQVNSPMLGAPSPLEAKANYLLAQIESVGHSFSVNADGTRSYMTTVQFSRGVITDDQGLVLKDSDQNLLITAIDPALSNMDQDTRVNPNVVPSDKRKQEFKTGNPF